MSPYENQERSNEKSDIEALNCLIIRPRKDSDELNDARKELIKNWKGSLDRISAIGIKRMGELDPEPFKVVVEINGVAEEFITEDDEQLQELKSDLGSE
ncbi:hypothetical protein IFM89_035682 [Coptis chinensis]|uniref:Factor of DNA methylation 1-5/IDN2 domain-containing protein n=1 Tax=Coptis chinensis TaxID=261450 RepID=A0A835IVD8_9MAGN|nr:hypothetical protein IFM89_035682 [Coptis chinensis]